MPFSARVPLIPRRPLLKRHSTPHMGLLHHGMSSPALCTRDLSGSKAATCFCPRRGEGEFRADRPDCRFLLPPFPPLARSHGSNKLEIRHKIVGGSYIMCIKVLASGSLTTSASRIQTKPELMALSDSERAAQRCNLKVRSHAAVSVGEGVLRRAHFSSEAASIRKPDGRGVCSFTMR